MKIYTKTGDKGETGLLGGVRVSKSHCAIRVCGSLDETNSIIGLVRAERQQESEGHDEVDVVGRLLVQLQHDLFDLGSRVAACLGETDRIPDFPVSRAEELERAIDQFQAELPALTAFILPSGTRAGTTLHLARSVCRRAERELVELVSEIKPKMDLTNELIYLNRMGDLLFVTARLVNQNGGQVETSWNVGRES